MNAAMNISVQESPLLMTFLRQLDLFHIFPNDHLKKQGNEITSPVDAFHSFFSLNCFIKESIEFGPVFTNNHATKTREGVKA
jgi:hypothetical protein